MKVVVTGGSGRAGGYIIADLLKHGYDAVNADITPPRPDSPGVRASEKTGKAVRFLKTDTTDFGEVTAALKGADAVIHMSAIPSPVSVPEHRVFAINMLSDWNVLEAAEVHGIRKVVKASSINAVGAVFSHGIVETEYLPIDEDHPTRAEDGYSQSKWLGEEMSEAFCRRRPMQIASMRFHGLWDRARQKEFRETGDKTNVTGRQAMHFWGWVDIAEAARATVLALEKDWTGHEAFFINATDTTLEVPTEEALAEAYPKSPLRRALPGFTSPISIEKARDVLGWDANVTWRDA